MQIGDIRMIGSSGYLTVILPCAGSGMRLGLKRPKELLEIVPGTRLIDLSLAHIRGAFSLPGIRVAVVIRPWKAEVVNHVRQSLPGVSVEAVMFDDSYKEWPGSVYSARETYSDHNLVLLPDSMLNLGKGFINGGPICHNAEGASLIELVQDALLHHKLVFGFIECKDRRVLKKMGALRVEEGVVTLFQDKPEESLEKYNGFWGCYAFRKEVGQSLYNFLIKSVQHQPVSLRDQPFYPPGIIRVESYRDLGTWSAIRKFRNEYSYLPEAR